MPFCFPPGQLFEVHGSKLKPHPFGNLGQTFIKRIAHADYFDVSLDYIFGRCDEPQGKLYEYRPRVKQGNPDLKLFVDMCFDPASPMSERLKEVLTKMLEEAGKK